MADQEGDRVDTVASTTTSPVGAPCARRPEGGCVRVRAGRDGCPVHVRMYVIAQCLAALLVRSATASVRL
jgi:hypothetical protein